MNRRIIKKKAKEYSTTTDWKHKTNLFKKYGYLWAKEAGRSLRHLFWQNRIKSIDIYDNWLPKMFMADHWKNAGNVFTINAMEESRVFTDEEIDNVADYLGW